MAADEVAADEAAEVGHRVTISMCHFECHMHVEMCLCVFGCLCCFYLSSRCHLRSLAKKGMVAAVAADTKITNRWVDVA